MATSTWPGLRKLRLVGGPSGAGVEAQLDGERIQKCSRVVVDAGVNDVVRITTYQFADLDVEVDGYVEDGGMSFRASVTVFKPQHLDGQLPKYERFERMIEATADTPWDALRDAATQLELSRGVAPSGTVVEPSGRPPGH